MGMAENSLLILTIVLIILTAVLVYFTYGLLRESKLLPKLIGELVDANKYLIDIIGSTITTTFTLTGILNLGKELEDKLRKIGAQVTYLSDKITISIVASRKKETEKILIEKGILKPL